MSVYRKKSKAVCEMYRGAIEQNFPLLTENSSKGSLEEATKFLSATKEQVLARLTHLASQVVRTEYLVGVVGYESQQVVELLRLAWSEDTRCQAQVKFWRAMAGEKVSAATIAMLKAEIASYRCEISSLEQRIATAKSEAEQALTQSAVKLTEATKSAQRSSKGRGAWARGSGQANSSQARAEARKHATLKQTYEQEQGLLVAQLALAKDLLVLKEKELTAQEARFKDLVNCADTAQQGHSNTIYHCEVNGYRFSLKELAERDEAFKQVNLLICVTGSKQLNKVVYQQYQKLLSADADVLFVYLTEEEYESESLLTLHKPLFTEQSTFGVMGINPNLSFSALATCLVPLSKELSLQQSLLKDKSREDILQHSGWSVLSLKLNAVFPGRAEQQLAKREERRAIAICNDAVAEIELCAERYAACGRRLRKAQKNLSKKQLEALTIFHKDTDGGCEASIRILLFNMRSKFHQFLMLNFGKEFLLSRMKDEFQIEFNNYIVIVKNSYRTAIAKYCRWLQGFTSEIVRLEVQAMGKTNSKDEIISYLKKVLSYNLFFGNFCGQMSLLFDQALAGHNLSSRAIARCASREVDLSNLGRWISDVLNDDIVFIVKQTSSVQENITSKVDAFAMKMKKDLGGAFEHMEEISTYLATASRQLSQVIIEAGGRLS